MIYLGAEARVLEPQSAKLCISVVTVRPAGFWIRLVAGVIDLILLGIPLIVFASFLSVAMGSWRAFLDLHPGQTPEQIHALFGPVFLALTLGFFVLIEWLYFAGLEHSSWCGTVGKFVLGLYVGDDRGNPLSFWRASLRFASGRLLMHVPYAGLYYFFVDCVCIGVVPGRRAIHDMLSGCGVLRKSAGDEFGERYLRESGVVHRSGKTKCFAR
jgi:uncharacterized RDD family membrane protein YckC